jgi:hypothetical protein
VQKEKLGSIAGVHLAYRKQGGTGSVPHPPWRDPSREGKKEHNSAFSRRDAPEVCMNIAPKKKREQGKPGARCTRGLACQDALSKKRTRAYRFSGSSPAFPAQRFYDLFRALPGDQALLTPSPCGSWRIATRLGGCTSTRLDAGKGASGPHDFAVRDLCHSSARRLPLTGNPPCDHLFRA